MTNNLISILLPVYNGSTYLADCINSLLNQTLDKYEIIICDDCSTDDSFSIIQSFALEPKIKIYKNVKNHGLFGNLKIMVGYSSGNIIRLFGQDDIMFPHCLEYETVFWRKFPQSGYIYCGRDCLNETGDISKNNKFDDTPQYIPSWLADQITYYWGPLPANISNASINKDALEKVGGFDEKMELAGDWDIYTRLQEFYPVGRNIHILVLVRDHSGQLSKKPGCFLKFFQEQNIILTRLYRRLPNSLKKEAKKISDYKRSMQIFHHSIRLLISWKYFQAYQLILLILENFSLITVILWWLISANGRWFKPRPIFKDSF